MQGLLADFRSGLRTLRRSPGYAAMIVLTLAVCIGAEVAVFSVVDSVLLQPLPGPDSDRIVLMANRYPNSGAGEIIASSGGDYVDRLRDVAALDEQALFQSVTRTLDVDGRAERIDGMEATPSLFRLLQAPALLGRTFTEAEGELGAHRKIVLSHALWRRLFVEDPAAVGRELRLDGRPYQIVGVLPEEFRFYDPNVAYWIPLALTPEQQQAHHSNNWFNIGRLARGASIEQVQAQVDALNHANLDLFPEMRQAILDIGFHTQVMPLKDHLVRHVRESLHLLWLGASLLLLVGALNAAGLVITRTAGRGREFGARLALGAGLGRLSRQTAVESLVLAFVGGGVGLALAWLVVDSFPSLGLDQFARAAEVAIGPASVLFTVGVSLLVGLLIAAFTVVHLRRLPINETLRDAGPSLAGGRRAGAGRRIVVAAQVSGAFVLLAGSALMLVSFRQLSRVEPGYRLDGVLTATTSVPEAAYPSPRLSAFSRDALAALRAIPGVEAAGAVSRVPLSQSFNDSVILPEGYVHSPGDSIASPVYLSASPGYFESMGVELLRGRAFGDRDTADSQRVLIVDEDLAERFWPGLDPIGRRLFQPDSPTMQVSPETEMFTVVGVVRRIRLKNLAGTDNSAGAYYFPFAQRHPRTFTFTVSTSRDDAALTADVRSALQRLDPTLPLFDVRTMAARAADSLSARRAALTLLLGFGALGLLLASVGLYGTLSYLLAQRRREVGVRLAVGCTPAGILRLFLGEGVAMVAAGLAVGLVVAVLARGMLESFVFGVAALDPLVLGAVAALLSAVALAAVAGPALAAARTEPSLALHSD